MKRAARRHRGGGAQSQQRCQRWGRDAADARCAEIHRLRAEDKPTLPTLLGTEKAANPFLNCDQPDLARVFGLDESDPVAVFTALRQGKDNF